MAFQAYPSSPKGGKAVSFQALWQAHGFLHKTDNIIIPATLLMISVSMAMYQHVTDRDTGDTSTRNFLILIFLSLFPLAFLEKKLMACKDPLGMISKFSTKVLMMHVGFLFIRFLSGILYFDYQTRFFHYRSRASFVVASIMLAKIFGFRLSRANIWEHRDVLLLVGIALLTAISTEWIDAYMKGFFVQSWFPDLYFNRVALFILISSSDYIEILAFVPAMWMVCRDDKNAEVKEADVAETQKRALALFVFILIFYTTEDLHSAFTIGMDLPMAAGGHIAHFLLLLDFSAYVLAHLYDPSKCEKLIGKIWNLIADSNLV